MSSSCGTISGEGRPDAGALSGEPWKWMEPEGAPLSPAGLWPFSRRAGVGSISVSLRGGCQEHCAGGRGYAWHPLMGRTSPKTTASEGNYEMASSQALSLCSAAPRDLCFGFSENHFIPKLTSVLCFKTQRTKYSVFM